MFATCRPWTAPTVAVLSFMAFAAVYLGAVGTEVGQSVDHALMLRISGLFGVHDPTVGAFGRGQFTLFAVAALVVGAVVAVRRSLAGAVAAFAVLVGTTAAAYVLKTVLVRPGLGSGSLHNSFPSNSVAVAAALTVIVILAAPRGWRALVVPCAVLFGGIVSLEVVALQWHRPADVLGAWLLAICATATARLALSAWTWTSAVEGSAHHGRAVAHRG